MVCLISVMMAAKNSEKFIGAAIQSIIDQTVHDWELLIVDDKSSDATKEIALSFARRDKRIKIMEGSGNGVVAARNTIIAHAVGKYIMVQDSDDVATPDRMHHLLAVAKKYSSVIVGSNMYIVNSTMNIVRKTNKPLDNKTIRAGFERYFNRCTIYPQTIMVSAELLKQLQYRDIYVIYNDWDFILRASKDQNVVFANIGEPVYYYRMHHGSLTSNNDNKSKDITLLRINEINEKQGKAEINSWTKLKELMSRNWRYSLWIYAILSLKKIQYSILNIRDRPL